MVALDVDSEDRAMVERNGLKSMLAEASVEGGDGRYGKYIPDRLGFDSFGGSEAFSTYVEWTLRRPWEILERMEKRRGTATTSEGEPGLIPFTYFVDRQMLRDEGMASAAVSWLEKNPNGLLVGLVGTNHVIFNQGVSARVARRLEERLGEREAVSSVVINPTPANTGTDLRRCDDGTVRNEVCLPNDVGELQNYVLQLEYVERRGESGRRDGEGDALAGNVEGGVRRVLALSDYIIFSPRPS